MRLLIQRVKRASVIVNGNVSDKRTIEQGVCVFIGVTHGDNEKKADSGFGSSATLTAK